MYSMNRNIDKINDRVEVLYSGNIFCSVQMILVAERCDYFVQKQDVGLVFDVLSSVVTNAELST